jgi:hypothetical protein
MPGKEVLLLGKGRGIPVTIQARLADGAHRGIVGKCNDFIPIAGLRLGQVIGLKSDGCIQDGMLLAELNGSLARGGSCSNGYDAGHAGCKRSFQDGRQIIFESVVIKVSMRVNKLRGHTIELRLEDGRLPFLPIVSNLGAFLRECNPQWRRPLHPKWLRDLLLIEPMPCVLQPTNTS